MKGNTILAERQIQAVVFDLAETLLNFGRFQTFRLFWKAAKITYAYLREHEQPVGSFQFYVLHFLLRLRWAYTIGIVCDRDFNSLEAIRRIGLRHGFRLSDDQWEELAWLWYKPVRDIARTENDMADTLCRLKRMGLQLGLLSNTFVHASALERHMEELGWLHCLEIRLYSYQFPFRKPDHRIFREAVRRLQIPLERTVYVGDNPRNDIRPALKLGMHAVMKRAYTNEGKRIPERAWVIDRISEVPGVIERILSDDRGGQYEAVPQSA